MVVVVMPAARRAGGLMRRGSNRTIAVFQGEVRKPRAVQADRVSCGQHAAPIAAGVAQAVRRAMPCR